MSEPTDIYEGFSRPLLENFTWQLQDSVAQYETLVDAGLEAGASVAMNYAFACPSDDAAVRLRDYIHEQAEDEISLAGTRAGCLLRGRVDEMAFDLALILRWVGYMCDAGSQLDCRFDGWRPNAPVDVAKPRLVLEPSARAGTPSAPPSLSPPAAPVPYPHRVTVRIFEKLEPIERGVQYEDPLHGVLTLQRLGEITGGGSQLNARGGIEYVEVEISLANLNDALDLTKRTLRQLGVPKGSELHVLHTTVVPIVE